MGNQTHYYFIGRLIGYLPGWYARGALFIRHDLYRELLYDHTPQLEPCTWWAWSLIPACPDFSASVNSLSQSCQATPTSLRPQRNSHRAPEGRDAIADAYWFIHRQLPSAWAQEIDLRPFKESF